jgi:MoaA/NifB/PqqE/SkfB family radical SAM enzyme
MCFNWQIINTETDELSLAEIEKFSKSIGTVSSVILGGGEPCLRVDLPEICKILYQSGVTKKIVLPTNCLLPDLIIDQTKKILEIAPVKLKVVLSLDGIGNVHDEIRGIQGNFEKFIDTYNRLEEISHTHDLLQVSVNTTISDKNQDNISAIIDYIDQHLKFKYHTAEVIRGTFDKAKIGPPALAKYEELIDQTLLKSQTTDRDPAHKLFYAYYHKLALKMMKRKKQILPCRSSSFFPVIDAWGNVYNCEMLPKLGNLRGYDYDLKKIWHSPTAQNQRHNIRNKKCWCTHYCYQSPNILISPWHLFKAVFGDYFFK